MLRKIAFFILVASLFTACNYNSSRMLKPSRNYKYSQKPSQPILQYKISPNDQLQFRLYANDGFKLIDLTSLTSGNNGNGSTYIQRNYLTYKVEFDGKVKLPLLGRVNIAGMTIRQAEAFLEQKYAKYYKGPFVLLSVANKRVIVFPGNGGDAKVVPLDNDNTTLLEGLALAGGISQNGKARKIKLIRGDIKNPQVYNIDLSTLKGAEAANFILQPNDIIYVEPRTNDVRQVVGTVAPIVSLITSVLTLYIILNNVKK